MTIIKTMNKDLNTLSSTEFLPLSEVKATLSAQVRKVVLEGKKIAITSNGRPKAVILAYQDFLEILQKLEPECGQATPLKMIDFNDWKKERPHRKRISESIKQLFDTSHLSRKGQKAYKQEKVKSFEKPSK